MKLKIIILFNIFILNYSIAQELPKNCNFDEFVNVKKLLQLQDNDFKNIKCKNYNPSIEKIFRTDEKNQTCKNELINKNLITNKFYSKEIQIYNAKKDEDNFDLMGSGFNFNLSNSDAVKVMKTCKKFKEFFRLSDQTTPHYSMKYDNFEVFILDNTVDKTVSIVYTEKYTTFLLLEYAAEYPGILKSRYIHRKN